MIEQTVVTFEQCDETDGNSDGVVLTNLRSFEGTISANFANEEFFISQTQHDQTIVKLVTRPHITTLTLWKRHSKPNHLCSGQ